MPALSTAVKCADLPRAELSSATLLAEPYSTTNVRHPGRKAGARESGGRGVAARPLAPGPGCVFGAYARAALSGRSRRAGLESKRRFRVGAAIVGSEACAPRWVRTSAIFEAAAARAATARAPGRRVAQAATSTSSAGEAAMHVHGRLAGSA